MFSTTPQRLLVLCAPILVLALVPLVAQEDEDNPRQHTDEKLFVHQDEPQFALKLPKKLRKHWKFVDLDARREFVVDKYDKKLAKEQDENRKNRIEKDKEGFLKQWDTNMKMLLENTMSRTVAKNMTLRGLEGVSNHLEVTVALSTTTQKIADVNPHKAFKEHWNGSVIMNKDTTTKKSAKKRRFSHVYETVASHKQDTNNNKLWIKIHTYIVYNKKQTNRFVVQITQRVPEAEATKELKKESAKLFAAIKVL